MHIHSSQTKLNATNPYFAAAEKATNGQRGPKVRRKPVKSVQAVEGETAPMASWVIGEWMGARQIPVQNDDSERPGKAARKLKFG